MNQNKDQAALWVWKSVSDFAHRQQQTSFVSEETRKDRIAQFLNNLPVGCCVVSKKSTTMIKKDYQNSYSLVVVRPKNTNFIFLNSRFNEFLSDDNPPESIMFLSFLGIDLNNEILSWVIDTRNEEDFDIFFEHFEIL